MCLPACRSYISLDFSLVWLCAVREQECVCAPLQDFSDLVAAKAAQQKRKAAEKKEGKAKKQKEQFKF